MLFLLRFTFSQWSLIIFLGRLPSWARGRGPACDNPSYFAQQRQTLYNFTFFAQKRTYFTINKSELVILNYFLEGTSFVYWIPKLVPNWLIYWKMAFKYYWLLCRIWNWVWAILQWKHCDEGLIRLWKAITLKCLEIIMISRTSKCWKMQSHIKFPF